MRRWWLVVKSTGTMYCDCVLADVEDGAVGAGGGDVDGVRGDRLAVAEEPIWLSGDGLQVGGWQTAVMEAGAREDGRDGAGADAGMVVGVVETYSRVRPVS